MSLGKAKARTEELEGWYIKGKLRASTFILRLASGLVRPSRRGAQVPFLNGWEGKANFHIGRRTENIAKDCRFNSYRC